MDYQRIYTAFIDNRKALQSTLTGYVEVHHIVPKSHGGSDDADNLIKLTAEDHFFAHLLLAKIHGGGMWAAVSRMRWGRVGGERHWVRGRYMYALARKRHAAATSLRCKGQPGRKGSDNGRHDATEIEWTNLDTGETITAAKSEMWDRFGGCRAHWTSAATGARKSHHGWTARPEASRIRGNKGKALSFVNSDGRTFTGTQSEFCKAHGVGAASASRVARHEDVTRCGWRLKGTWERLPTFAKQGRKHGKRQDRTHAASA